MRRTKKEMEQMESDIRYYLMYNNLDAHKAYDSYIKDHLLSGQPMAYYINGIKDFIKFESIMKSEQEQKEKRKIEEQKYQEQKQNIVEQILSLPYEKFMTAFKEAKETGTNNHKMALCDMANLQYAGELKEKFITSYYIDVCRQYNLIA